MLTGDRRTTDADPAKAQRAMHAPLQRRKPDSGALRRAHDGADATSAATDSSEGGR